MIFEVTLPHPRREGVAQFLRHPSLIRESIPNGMVVPLVASIWDRYQRLRQQRDQLLNLDLPLAAADAVGAHR